MSGEDLHLDVGNQRGTAWIRGTPPINDWAVVLWILVWERALVGKDAPQLEDARPLAESDTRGMLRALHALHDERTSFATRLNALARDLAVLTGSLQCVIGEVDANGGTWPLRLTPRGTFADLTSEEIRHVMGCFEDAAAPDLLAGCVLESPHHNGGAVTMSAHRTFGREVWRSKKFCTAYMLPAGLDDLLHSRAVVEMRPRCFGWIGLGRAAAGPSFTAREAAIVNMLHAEVGTWLWTRIAEEEAGTATPQATNRAYQALLGRLSPAQQRVLPLLVRGLKEEDIGTELKRSRHTIHDHAKSIYAAAGVRSRLELILQMAAGNGSADMRSGMEDGV